MKTFAAYTIYTFLLISSLISCKKDFVCERGTGKVSKREFTLAEINKIVLKGSGNVYITQAESQKVEIETHEDLFDHVNTNVNDGKWEIDFKDCVSHFKTFNVYISVKDLKELKVTGSGDIEGQNHFNVGDLELAISGSGKIQLSTDAAKITSSISGSGKIFLNGSGQDHDISISGSGDIKAEDFSVKTTNVKTSGSGKSYVNVSEKLDVKISGSGDVYYKGSPIVNTSVSGSGKVEKI